MAFSRIKGFVYGPSEFLWDGLQWLNGTRGRLRKDAAKCQTDVERLAFAEQCLQPCQKSGEILPFLAWLREWRPVTVIEIGVARGGTTYLLTTCVPSVRQVIGVDFYPRNRSLLGKLKSPQVRSNYACGSSRSPEVLAKVESLLGGIPVDLLFIDGDHAYDGVRADWLNFKSLVRPGGWIAFHDIEPPERFPDGSASNGFAVEVDRFWREVSAGKMCKTFTEKQGQFGYGIGLVQVE